MSDYYDYAALVDLTRPIVLTSHFGEISRAVGHRASALLGLPFHDVDRLVEHDAGQDLRRLVLVEGEAAYLEIEARCLESVVVQQPAGVVALGAGGLSREVMDQTARQADVVVIDFDLAHLYWRIRALCRERALESWSPLFDGLPEGPLDLRPYFDRRRQALASTAFTIDARGRGVAAVSDALVRWIRSREAV